MTCNVLDHARTLRDILEIQAWPPTREVQQQKQVPFMAREEIQEASSLPVRM